MKCVFVTGASGVVGSEVVKRLLAEPHATVIVLLRASDELTLRERFDALKSEWLTPTTGIPAAVDASRVSVLRGDTELAEFGLCQEAYQQLAERVTHIVHCAAIVRMNLPIDKARAAAVQAAHNVIALAWAAQRQGQFVKLEFVSTVGVAGRHREALQERFVTEARSFHNTYEEAKAEAEDVLRDAIQEGLLATVHRPSMVIGGQADGHIARFQIFYFLCEFLSGRRTGGWFPDFGTARLDVIPVDFVAWAIVRSTSQPTWAGRIIHLCAGPQEAIPLQTLQQMTRQAFAAHGAVLPREKRVPAWLFDAASRVAGWFLPGSLKRSLAALPIFLEYLRDSAPFENAATVALFALDGVTFPDPYAAVTKSLDYYIRVKAAEAGG